MTADDVLFVLALLQRVKTGASAGMGAMRSLRAAGGPA